MTQTETQTPLWDLIETHLMGRSWNAAGRALGISGNQVRNYARGAYKLPEYRTGPLADFLEVPVDLVREAAGYPPLQAGDRDADPAVRGVQETPPNSDGQGISVPERRALREAADRVDAATGEFKKAVDAFTEALTRAMADVRRVGTAPTDEARE